MLIIIFIVFGLCFILERIIPGWKLAEVPTWTIRVLAVNFVQLGVVTLAGVTWEKWFSAYSLFNLSDHTGPIAGGLIAYLLQHLFFIGGIDGGTKWTFCGPISIKSIIALNA